VNNARRTIGERAGRRPENGPGNSWENSWRVPGKFLAGENAAMLPLSLVRTALGAKQGRKLAQTENIFFVWWAAPTGVHSLGDAILRGGFSYTTKEAG
jgi:hypothetical protein